MRYIRTKIGDNHGDAYGVIPAFLPRISMRAGTYARRSRGRGADLFGWLLEIEELVSGGGNCTDRTSNLFCDDQDKKK
jgi:hypothetical protein